MQQASNDEFRHTDDLIAAWLAQSDEQAVIVMDAHGVVTGWYAGAPSVLGFSHEDAIGKHIALIFTDEDRHQGYPDYELRVAVQNKYSEDSRWHVRKDGARIWASGTVSAVRDGQGKVLGFVKMLRDLTDQHAHTQRFVNELAERDQARTNTHNFLKMLGHEMRNPLAVLTNVTQILDRLVEDPRGKRALQQVPDQLAVLRKMADDLMDVARLELGKVRLQLGPVDLKSLLDEATASMQSAAAAKSIRLECILPPGAISVRGDRERLIQVVSNLLSNAVKYTQVKGAAWVTLSEEGHEAVVRVEDNGIGIFPPVLPKIFDLFTQASEGEAMRAGGIGIGLALVRQLAELHGGTVQAKSLGLGKGSEFSFRLPIHRAEPA